MRRKDVFCPKNNKPDKCEETPFSNIGFLLRNALLEWVTTEVTLVQERSEMLFYLETHNFQFLYMQATDYKGEFNCSNLRYRHKLNTDKDQNLVVMPIPDIL